ncbi:MAG: FkbM family methyltransferase [Ignavibacteria bacterium]
MKNGVFIDVGSNTGQTLIELRSVDENIVYYGFEPNPTCVSYCINLIKVNKFSKSYIIPVGVFSENKVLNIHLTSETDSSGTIIEDLRPGYPVIERYLIPVMTFESIQKTVNIDDISIVKIDVEGSELEVFRSLEFTITKYKPIILCEILWAHNEDKLSYVSENNSKIIDLVHKMGYEIYRLIKSEDNNDVKSLENVKGIEKYVYSSSNSDLCDYIMIHQDYIEKVRELFPSNI